MTLDLGDDGMNDNEGTEGCSRSFSQHCLFFYSYSLNVDFLQDKFFKLCSFFLLSPLVILHVMLLSLTVETLQPSSLFLTFTRIQKSH